MKLSLILEAKDRASRAVDGLRRSVIGVDKAARKGAGGIGAMDRSAMKAERSTGKLAASAERMGFAIGSAARRGVTGLFALERRLTISRESMGKLAAIGGGLLGAGAAIAGGAVMGGVIGGLYKVVSAGMMFEKFRTQLTGLMGSVAAGNKAMDWVTDFARKTPYEVAQVMEAFIRLKAYGIDPTDGSLRTLGDTAGGMGKDLMQAVEMIADAQTGEFERLKEFGIKASQKGQQVTFSFMRDGKTMTRVVKKNATEITRTLFDIFNTRFAGGMDRLSATTEGKWSNVMDRMTISAKRVWEAGFGASVNRQLDRFSAWIDKLEADGSLKKWSDETGQSLGDFVKKMGEADWKGIGKDVATVAGAIADLAKALAWLNREDSGPAQALNGVGGAVDRAGRRSHDAVQGLGGGDWSGMRGPAAPAKPGTPWYERSIFDFSWMHPGKPAPSPRTNRPPAPATPRPAPAPQGKISLEVRAAPGVAVKPMAISATGMDLQVNTGRAMAGPA